MMALAEVILAEIEKMLLIFHCFTNKLDLVLFGLLKAKHSTLVSMII